MTHDVIPERESLSSSNPIPSGKSNKPALSTPNCDNCGALVTQQYVRVFAPTGMVTVRIRPGCPDMLRDDGGIREAKSKHRNQPSSFVVASGSGRSHGEYH
ncbi:DUF7563 family protein [Halococcus salsus]|uniref:DUF7563 family protein n=1 Tax=Halococcus salsus TaxID=2162894 RepID=UPI003B8386F8